MPKFFALGINVAIIALLAGSLLSGKPLWTNTAVAGATPTMLTLNSR